MDNWLAVVAFGLGVWACYIAMTIPSRLLLYTVKRAIYWHKHDIKEMRGYRNIMRKRTQLLREIKDALP